MPRNPATNAVRGVSYSSVGVPSCSILPSCMTAIVSAMVMASSWSWVTWTNVIPTSFWMPFSSSCICLRSFRSSAPSGSSRRRTRGRFTSARASATRCCWPPGELARLAPLEPGERDELERRGHALVQLCALDAPALEPEGDVVGDRQVREERVALEHGVDVALVRRQAGDVAVAEVDGARGRLLEAADHAQARRLAAARGAEQGEEAPARDLERDVVDRGDVVEALRHALEPDVGRGHRGLRPALDLLVNCHVWPPRRWARRRRGGRRRAGACAERTRGSLRGAGSRCASR